MGGDTLRAIPRPADSAELLHEKNEWTTIRLQMDLTTGILQILCHIPSPHNPCLAISRNETTQRKHPTYTDKDVDRKWSARSAHRQRKNRDSWTYRAGWIYSKGCWKDGLSYKKAWTHIKILQKNISDELVIPQKGGGFRGGTTLTPNAKELIMNYRQLQLEIGQFANKRFDELFLK